MKKRRAVISFTTCFLVLSFHFSPLVTIAAEGEPEGEGVEEVSSSDVNMVSESAEEEVTGSESTNQIEEKVESEVDESKEVKEEFNVDESEEVETKEEPEVASDLAEEELVESDVEMSTLSVASDSLQPGDRNEQVLEMKLDLMKLGFGTHWSNPTNYFGPDTERVVREFQAYYGLTVNGRGDQATLAKIAEELSSPFQEGKRSEQIREIKLDLMKLGFGTHWSNPTTLYGPDTANVVREFQRHYGLVVNGIIDEVTYKKIEELKAQSLAPGIRRDDVIDFKLDLMKLGFGTHWSNPTNYFGPDTEKVVREFQAYYGLTVNGHGDEATLAKIAEQLASPFQEGKRSEQIREIKLDLMKLGFGTHWSNPTTLYGPDTANVVRQFQRHHGLVVNGIIDQVTYKKIEELKNKALERGVRRADVIDFKLDLMKLGFGTHWSNPTDYFGPDTEKVVREFQAYYELTVNGRGDEATLKKIQEILSSPLQRGARNEQVRKLKEDLMRLGYGVHWSNPTTLFGAETEEEVRKFQRNNNLPVSGIADAKTLDKISELLKAKEIVTYTQYNLTLSQAAARQLQLNPPPQTDKYRNDPAYIHSSLVDIVLGGTITGSTVNLRTSPNNSSSSNIYTSVSRGTAFVIQDNNVTGSAVNGNTRWYKITYDNRTLYVHSSLASESQVAVVKSTANIRQSASSSSHIFGSVTSGTRLTVQREVTGTTVSGSNRWYEITYQTWRNATQSDFLPYLDPNQNDRFQHLVLDRSVGVSAQELNKVLAGKGILDGKGQAFIEAGRTHSVNEIYLIAHALLETGNGRSSLATGIEVGRNSSGNLVLVTSSNRSSLTNIRTTYNMFGIGAHDSDPYRLGAIRAYQEGWFTPEAAIIGGAQFISNSYFARGQNTLYKMRWNHLYQNASGGFPQYATDMGWAVKQVPRIKELYQQLDNPVLRFDIVRYN
ncbi:peptidoglycan-binding protein [Halalkalibacterium halodurans]|uniref:peptidoglycan-binding protein n=1 Tax=Halalkalibacterium halodurans TaxID=86665 RepID=UPI0030C8F4AF